MQRFLPELLNYVEEGNLQPEVIISHRMSPADRAHGYPVFDERDEECRKVVLTPRRPAT